MFDYNSGDENSIAPPSVLATTPVITPASSSSSSSSSSSKQKKRRHSYELKEKQSIVQEVKSHSEDAGSQTNAILSASALHGIPFTTINNWMREENLSKISKFSKDPKFNKRKKKIFTMKEGYFIEVEQELVALIIEERAQGAAIGISWAIEKAKELNIDKTTQELKYPDAQFSTHWVERVLARNGMAMKVVQNTRKESVFVAIPKVLKWHQNLRKLIQTKVVDLISYFIIIIMLLFDYYYVYGRYSPSQRLNVDQVPLVFASKPRKVISIKGIDHVWVAAPSSGLQKRQCSVILTIVGDGSILHNLCTIILTLYRYNNQACYYI